MSEEIITRVTREEIEKMEDLSDWEWVKNMTEEEAHQNALDDPDAQPINEDMTGLKRIHPKREVAAEDQD